MSVLEQVMYEREMWCRRNVRGRFESGCRAAARFAGLAAIILALMYRTQVLSFVQEHLSL